MQNGIRRVLNVDSKHSTSSVSTQSAEALQVPEVRRAVALFRSAALTVASYEAMGSADMTPDEHNTWYDKLNVMREARAVLAEAGQLHLIATAVAA